MEKLELSQVIEQDGRMKNWAYKMVNKQELSEEDKAISQEVNGFIKKVDKLGSATASEAIAEFITKIVEPEIFSEPTEVLEAIFNSGSYGEFDKINITKSPKNTLVARESAARTGNVDKSYLDFKVGNVVEKHLQIETEIKLSDLRRQGALAIAQYVVYAIEAFNSKKFNIILNHVSDLIKSGGENYFECTGNLTKQAIDDFTGYLYDNCFEGEAEVVGLSSAIRQIYSATGIVDYMSDAMKGELNNLSILKMYNGSYLVPIKAGKTLGDGSKLLPEKTLFGFAGKVGEMYTKGELRTLQDVDIDREVIDLKFTGVEFGFSITQLEKVAKLVIK